MDSFELQAMIAAAPTSDRAALDRFLEDLGVGADPLDSDAEARARVIACAQADLAQAREDEAAEAKAARAQELDDAACEASRRVIEAVLAALPNRRHYSRIPEARRSSVYFDYRGVTIRISDHAQVSYGGFRTIERRDGSIEQGRFGEAEVSLVTSQTHTRASIRAAVAEALRAQR